jgi:hypothetical protein
MLAATVAAKLASQRLGKHNTGHHCDVACLPHAAAAAVAAAAFARVPGHQTTVNTNANTRVGQWGARSTYADANNRVIVPNPFYGTLFNDQTNVNIFTDSTQISQAATTPLTVVDTFSTGFDTGATVGSYLPGGWILSS